MTDIHIRIEGRAGRITLARPEALNALTYEMVLAIEAAIDTWRTSDLDLILIDAEGDRAFCSGGDISEMYASGQRRDFEYGRKFWRDEYRLNAKLFHYPKPIVSFLQGFTMGGGVGVGCHGSHRIVGESSQIAMPECGIGLVPDVGGSFMLAGAPGRLGEFLGVTGTRMGAADAIFAGFADHFVPESDWKAVKAEMITTGQPTVPVHSAHGATLEPALSEINRAFSHKTLGEIERVLGLGGTEVSAKALKALKRNAPLAMACCVEIVRRLRDNNSLRNALDLEYRFTHRCMAQGDFIEGIRAAIIDKDRNPKWAHAEVSDVLSEDVTAMLAPLDNNMTWENMT